MIPELIDYLLVARAMLSLFALSSTSIFEVVVSIASLSHSRGTQRPSLFCTINVVIFITSAAIVVTVNVICDIGFKTI